MPSFLRIAVVALALGGLAPMAASAATVPGCANPADSAFNQYCETIPSAGGAQTPRPGLPTLGVSLPTRVDKQLSSGKDARSRRALLAVPAPTSRPRNVSLSLPAISTAGTSTFPVWLIVVLIATALALGAVAAARWRRLHRPGPQDGASV